MLTTKEFKTDMDSFIVDIKKDIKVTFLNEDFEKQKNLMQNRFEQQKTDCFQADPMETVSQEQGREGENQWQQIRRCRLLVLLHAEMRFVSHNRHGLPTD